MNISNLSGNNEMLKIRPAHINDIPHITRIYNDAIVNTTATFDTEQKSEAEQEQWFMEHGEKYPVIIAEQEGEIAGWASLSRWSDRCAYDKTAEVSLYVDVKYRGMGIGKKLLEMLILEGKAAGLHNLVSRITEGNRNSIHIHEKFGFRHIGVMQEAGTKFGKMLDVHFMQKLLD
jgi:phosphinothricin acetyltransferase